MSNGKIYVVGIGSGKKENMTFRAYEAMENSDIIVGYKTYVDLVKEYYPGKEMKRNPPKKSAKKQAWVMKKPNLFSPPCAAKEKKRKPKENNRTNLWLLGVA